MAYRAVRLTVRLVGERRTFALLADVARLSHRLCYESAGRLLGQEEFHGAALALDDEALRRAIPKGGSVLDIGCGTGRWCRAAAPYAGRVVGIDRNPARVRLARQRTASPNVEFLVGDADGGDVRGPFDVALLIHVVEHLDDPGAFLNRMRSLTHRILIEVPDFESDPLNIARLAEGCDFSSDGDHVREYTERTLIDALASSGWKVEWSRKRGGAIVALAGAETSPTTDP